MTYKTTIRACYIGTICQAIIIHLTAILFIPLGEQFDIRFTQLGTLVAVNFGVQVTTTLAFGTIVDKLGFRQFIVAANILAVVGMGLFSATPILPFPPYATLMAGTVIFAMAGGFMELLLSPILNAIPEAFSQEKSSAMSILHAFFCFGHLAVALVTTLILFQFGREAWPIAPLVWAAFPLVNIFLFAKCPLAAPRAAGAIKQKIGPSPYRKPLFFILLGVILFAGASEITFSQWSSAYLEEVIGLPKVVGDMLGVSLFAAMMGLSRLGYGILKRQKVSWLPSQARLMKMGAALAVASYLLMAWASHPLLALLACGLCGLGVGLLWPGALSLAVDAFPIAGTWIFALMAAAGNIGSSVGPWSFGVIADMASLRAGFIITGIFPIGALVLLALLMAKPHRGAPPKAPHIPR